MKFRVPEIFLGIFLSVAIFAIGMLFASSFQPQHAPQTATSEQKSSDKKTEDRTQTQSLWVPTDSVGLYTLVLAVFTGLLTLVSAAQGYFLLRADKTARIAANAADLSARAAIAIELPIIRANTGQLGYSTGPNKGVWVSYVLFSNLGRTKCFPIEVQIGCAIGDRLPEIPIYRFAEAFDTNSILDSVPAPSIEISLTKFQFEAPEDVYERLRTKKTNLWFYCNVIYLDFMQTRHEAGFCWKCHETIGMGVLLEDATPAYNRKT